MAFRFLTTSEFEGLSPEAKLAYLSDAMEELDRLKVNPQRRNWDSLFRSGIQDREPPESK